MRRALTKLLLHLVTEPRPLPSVGGTGAIPKVPTCNCSILYVVGPTRAAGSVGPYQRDCLGAGRPGHSVLFQTSRDPNCDSVKVSDAPKDFLGNVITHLPDYTASFKGPRY